MMSEYFIYRHNCTILIGLVGYLSVLGQASELMKMLSVMSSRTWRRNSALAHASAVDSILFGFNSQDWRDSMILKIERT